MYVQTEVVQSGTHSAANVTNAYLAILAASNLSVASQIVVPAKISFVRAFHLFSVQGIAKWSNHSIKMIQRWNGTLTYTVTMSYCMISRY